ncbi:DRBM domain-containing protein [Caenorhabditis elegans]|uniref:DRBM domain-containing protein n=1 Tax=Caenorhabditis elegans TaxID=6239 RepID=Q94239_CAEEL|nr:DRBM domain-containing protein [Caenorhabditis elegans]CCD62871.1 DRBM domain-containing protein [Caenorhabditis elegans]|eukprot:NP_508196.1 STAUfen (dsRNA binding protein) homolog [Caenorhabditis elegans]
MQAVFETTLTQKMDGVMIVQETTTDLADTLENASISAEKSEQKPERLHPQHWCGQHKFEADSPTNFYDYTNAKEKEKSAMCRVAEIARFNKLRHVYNLQDESGPAHKKLFTVKLVLTEAETFEGSGTSIKRAQQASAEAALKGTKLPLPTEKPTKKRINDTTKPHRVLQNVCRTLQYQMPNYISCNPPVYPDPGCPLPEHILLPLESMALYAPPFPTLPIDPARPQGPKLQAVIVNINGKSIATGIGETYPLAKQDAAAKALAVLSPLLREHQNGSDNGFGKENIPVHKQKSVISDIHEKAYQLKVNVVFEVLKEEGPPHDRQYVVRCAFVTSGNVVKAEAVGKGKKKKSAQQEACTQLLATVEHLTPENNPVALATNVCKTQKKLAAMNREPKRKTIVKDKKMDPLYGHQINPVSRLIQVTQAKSKEHPTFELVAEHGVSKYKEFIIQVKYGDDVQEGKGPNKRLAKRAAAEAMLESIGFVKPLPPPGKSLLKKMIDCDPSLPEISHWTGPPPTAVSVSTSEPDTSEAAQLSPEQTDISEKRELSPDTEKRRVTFNSQVHACPPPGDQDYPNSIVQSLKKDAIVEGKIRRLKRSKENRRALTAEQIVELSERAQSYLQTKNTTIQSSQSSSAHHHLEQLSDFFKFSLQYTSFPQVGIDQHFTIVSIGLEAPLVGHGTGCSTTEADENAALDAIAKLKELSASKT